MPLVPVELNFSSVIVTQSEWSVTVKLQFVVLPQASVTVTVIAKSLVPAVLAVLVTEP